MLKLQQLAAALSDRYLHLILFPTEQCNFRCTYCYEDFEAKQMDPVIAARPADSAVRPASVQDPDRGSIAPPNLGHDVSPTRPTCRIS